MNEYLDARWGQFCSQYERIMHVSSHNFINEHDKEESVTTYGLALQKPNDYPEQLIDAFFNALNEIRLWNHLINPEGTEIATLPHRLRSFLYIRRRPTFQEDEGRFIITARLGL